SDECEWVRDAVRQLQDIVDTRAWEAGWRLDLSAVTRPVVPYEVWQAPAGWPITWPSRWCRPDIPGQLVWTAGSLSPRERDRLRYEEQVRMLQDQLTQAER